MISFAKRNTKSFKYCIVAAIIFFLLFNLLERYISYRVSIELSNSKITQFSKNVTANVKSVFRSDYNIQIFIISAGHMTSGSDENRYNILKYVLSHLDDPNIKIHIATNETKFLKLKPRWSPISFSNAVKGDGKVAIQYLDFNSRDFDYFIFMEDDILITAKQIYRFIELKNQVENDVNQTFKDPNGLKPLLTFIRFVSYGRTLRSENSYGRSGKFLSDSLYHPGYRDMFSASFLLSSEQYRIMQKQRDLKRYAPDDTIGGSKVGGSPVWANMGLSK